MFSNVKIKAQNQMNQNVKLAGKNGNRVSIAQGKFITQQIQKTM